MKLNIWQEVYSARAFSCLPLQEYLYIDLLSASWQMIHCLKNLISMVTTVHRESCTW